MKHQKSWSFNPYKPVFFDIGDIYINRLVPSSSTIHFEWNKDEAVETYNIYCRERNCGDFAKVGETKELFFDITNLEAEKEFEFYVEADGKKSRIRLARTGEAVGVVVNYLHPEDHAYKFSGQFLCSPSLVRHPMGHLLSSMDVYEGSNRQCFTMIFRSDDDGKTWYHIAELYPAFWGKMFVHKGDVYMLACSTEYGDLLIGKSTDGGHTWSEPTTLLRGDRSNLYTNGVHKNPQPVVEFAGRLWNTIEWNKSPKGFHAPMVASVPVDADLLDSDSWAFSEPIDFDENWPGVESVKIHDGNMEGSLVIIDGELYSIMRWGINPVSTPAYGLVLGFKVNTEDPEAPLEYWRAIEFPGNRSKFTIKFDEVTKKYYSICTRLTNPYLSCRNLLTLMVSDDAVHWSVLKDIYDYRHMHPQKAGFQYVDFEIEGDDIIFLCRTGLNEPHGFHDTNYQTFDRIENFRKLVEDAGELEIFHVL